MGEVIRIDAVLGPDRDGSSPERLPDDEALDAYSRTVGSVAARLPPAAGALIGARAGAARGRRVPVVRPPRPPLDRGRPPAGGARGRRPAPRGPARRRDREP